MDLQVGANITWLAGGSELIAMPQGIPVATGASAQAGKLGPAHSRGRSSLRLIVVRVGKRGEPVHARRVTVPGISGSVLAAGSSAPGSLLIARLERHRTVIDQVSLAGARSMVQRLMSLPGLFPVAFDIRGDHFFYLVGHGPTALWLARIGRGRLIGAHRLLRNAGGPVAW
jgi:hypothetical protein